MTRRGLGRVDGFRQDKSEDKGDEGAETASRFLASESNSFEALELADELLDAGAGPMSAFAKNRGGLFFLALYGITGQIALSRAAARFLRFA